MDFEGWVRIEEVLQASMRASLELTREELEELVATDERRRFSLDARTGRLRANHGHTIRVDLGLLPVPPPVVLYHGTASRFLPQIIAEGISRMERNHVHLTHEEETARAIATRHGRPVVLLIEAAAMQSAGMAFYRAESGLWLTDHVSPQYIRARRISHLATNK